MYFPLYLLLNFCLKFQPETIHHIVNQGEFPNGFFDVADVGQVRKGRTAFEAVFGFFDRQQQPTLVKSQLQVAAADHVTEMTDPFHEARGQQIAAFHLIGAIDFELPFKFRVFQPDPRTDLAEFGEEIAEFDMV